MSRDVCPVRFSLVSVYASTSRALSRANARFEQKTMRHATFAMAAAVARALSTSAPLHDVTPLIRSAALSNKLNCDVFFKMDCAQPPGSFKLRGIGATVKEAVENGADGVVSSSGGNAGLATAHSARAPCAFCAPRAPRARGV